jgi:hypothetical protein
MFTLQCIFKISGLITQKYKHDINFVVEEFLSTELLIINIKIVKVQNVSFLINPH